MRTVTGARKAALIKKCRDAIRNHEQVIGPAVPQLLACFRLAQSVCGEEYPPAPLREASNGWHTRLVEESERERAVQAEKKLEMARQRIEELESRTLCVNFPPFASGKSPGDEAVNQAIERCILAVKEAALTAGIQVSTEIGKNAHSPQKQ
ncbi:TPA: hypothetical protein ACW0I5_004492 [Escherichia coli]